MAITIQDVIDRLSGTGLAHTVDKLTGGNPSDEVTGIGVAFMPTVQVISKAAELGVNLLIPHEAHYYSHFNPIGELMEDPVYLDKLRLIEQSGVAIFRNHDHVHFQNPDIITAGLIDELKWTNYVEKHHPISSILKLPPMTLQDVAAHIKASLGIGYIRVIGELNMTCERAGVLVGYRGGAATAIPLVHPEQLDLLIVGESQEWETPEYIRDAVQQGRQKALIVLGHAESEVPGMRMFAEQLRTMFASVKVHYIEEQPLFQIV
ncbi:Nif3-like dinuclear metal center hexameric protein [Paenibacillus kobensis]|uniref:Nif3-like dinuclear metal center hexameric protein n=1 Tax=Paenibacillus kobensis TaxID=59841 RepID=UPI000FDCB04C|nr:Nif3-like dinuclear metal center hexameric protein [Paenibacillus kobensis]